jgi:signal transduction histidine kinase
MFLPFFTTKPGGSGLGLAIVHRIVEEHHGHVDVHSEIAQGTQVVVALPAGAGEEASPSALTYERERAPRAAGAVRS